MKITTRRNLRNLALIAALSPAAAFAQSAANTEQLLAMDRGELRGEIQTRYDAALGLTRDAGVVDADNPRFLWASQAKAQCGIALGYLKSGTKDPVSVGKCNDAWNRMQIQPPAVIAAAPPATNEACAQPIAGIVFFDWDSAVLPESAMQTIDAVVANVQQCAWKGLSITGHTDRSGSDAYNDALSLRRAQAVAGVLGGRGVSAGQLAVTGRGEAEPKVPTVDGERNPTNRRVEINVTN